MAGQYKRKARSAPVHRPRKHRKTTARKTRKTKTVRGSRPRGKETQVVGSYTKNSRSLGRRPRKTLRAAWKVIDSNKTSLTQIFNRYNAFGGARGMQEMVNSSAGALGVYTPPCHLYDLTSTNNIQGTTVVEANPYLQPDFTNITDTGVLSWQPNYGYNGKNWIPQDTGGTSAQAGATYPSAECVLEWVSIKLLMYCPSAMVSKTTIDVCQFTDDRVVPGAVSPYATAFWQAATKKYAYSPLESGGLRYNKYIRRLHSQSFIMEPKESDEVGELNHYREVNIFLRINRSCRYDWTDQDPMYMQQLDTQQDTSAYIQTIPKPKARIFLMIRGQAQYTPTYSYDVSRHPSYDIVIRKKQSQLQ